MGVGRGVQQGWYGVPGCQSCEAWAQKKKRPATSANYPETTQKVATVNNWRGSHSVVRRQKPVVRKHFSVDKGERISIIFSFVFPVSCPCVLYSYSHSHSSTLFSFTFSHFLLLPGLKRGVFFWSHRNCGNWLCSLSLTVVFFPPPCDHPCHWWAAASIIRQWQAKTRCHLHWQTPLFLLLLCRC